jgi:predicted DNA-binding transcriptional regulator AlpA
MRLGRNDEPPSDHPRRFVAGPNVCCGRGGLSMALGSMSERRDVLPLSLPPRGLSRVEASAYVGVSPSLFDQMVGDGRMPKPKTVNARVIWDRLKLDEAFTALPDRDGEEPGNPWDRAMGLAG